MAFDADAVLAEIRRRDPELADEMDREEREVGYAMPDVVRVRLDAWLTGQGYLVNGRRVDPAQVVVVRVSDETADPGREQQA